MSDYDFFEDGFDDMVKEQKKSSPSSSEKTRFPISYLGAPGTYIFRLYPENYNGKPRMRRVVWSNQLNNYKRVIPDKGDTRVDDLVKEAIEQKLESKTAKFWSHKKTQDAIMMGYLYSGPEHKNIQPSNTASAFIMNWKQLKGLDSFLEGLEAEGVSLRKFLHPGKPSNAIKMVIEKTGSGINTVTTINFSSTVNSDFELPPMTESLPQGMEFPGLDEIHVSTSAVLTEELFQDFKKYHTEKVSKILKDRNGSAQSPGDPDKEQGYKVEFDDEGDSGKS